MMVKMKVDAVPDPSDSPPGSLSGKNRLFHRSLAGKNPQLFAAILAFNRAVTHGPGFVDPGGGTVHGLSMADLNRVLNGSSRAKARLLSSDSPGFWDFEEESRRMALLDPPLFNDLILSWGAAFCAPLLNRIILRQEVEILDREVGSPLVAFARGRGRFYLGDLSGIIPLLDKAVKPGKILCLIMGYGMQAYGICCATWPTTLQNFVDQRLEQVLPELYEQRSGPVQVSPSHLRAVWFSMKKILLKEVAPQWTPCFS